jgi:hypothetical protein
MEIARRPHVFVFSPSPPSKFFSDFYFLTDKWNLYISGGIKSCKQFMNCCAGDYKTRSLLDGVWT